jgi:hypothetical protein
MFLYSKQLIWINTFKILSCIDGKTSVRIKIVVTFIFRFHCHPIQICRINRPVVHGVMGCGQKKLSVSVVVPPAPVRVPSQRPLAPSVTSVASDKEDSEMILGAVHRSPGICLMAEENPRKPQLGDHLMKGLCDQSSPQMGSLSSKWGR